MKEDAGIFAPKRVAMYGLIVAGILALLVLGQWDWHKAIEHLAVAGVVAGILGLTLDYWLKREIAQDAVQHAIGYLLPEEIRSEMGWLYSIRILCIEHDQTVRLERLPDDFVRCTVDIRRKFKNVSKGNQSFTPGFSGDEWFIDGHKSRVLEMGFAFRGETKKFLEADIKTIKSEGAGLSAGLDSVTLKAGEEYTFWQRYEETKRVNDDHHTSFRTPTVAPRVKVIAPPELGYHCGFAYRDPSEVHSDLDSVRLTGLLQAHQHIRVRWWDPEQERQWREAA